jgi:hypothetical protein
MFLTALHRNLSRKQQDLQRVVPKLVGTVSAKLLSRSKSNCVLLPTLACQITFRNKISAQTQELGLAFNRFWLVPRSHR